MATATLIGSPVNRVDGRKKVTGSAQYAAEAVFGNMTYGVLVGSAIPNGRISRIHREEVEKLFAARARYNVHSRASMQPGLPLVAEDLLQTHE